MLTHTLIHTHIPGEGGKGCWRDARTFTAATFFAHLLTLRMFRVYFFNPVTLRKDQEKKKKEKNEEGQRTHLCFRSSLPLFFYIISICILDFFFFVLTVTPAWNQVIPTGMRCQRALCLESSRTRKQCTLTLPSPLQKKQTNKKTNPTKRQKTEETATAKRGVMGHA